MANNLDLQVITYQDNLRSLPPRENFTDIETEFNALKEEVDTVSAATTTTAITHGRDGFDNLYDRTRKLGTLNGNGVIFDRKTLATCNMIDDFTAVTNAAAPVRNTDNYVRGPASVEIQKSGTSSRYCFYDIDIDDTTLNDCYFIFNIYIPDYDTYNMLEYIKIYIAKEVGITNYRIFSFVVAELKQGWNELKCDWNNPDSTNGTVVDSDVVTHARLGIKTVNVADTTSTMLIDDIYLLGNDLRVIENDTPDMTVKLRAGSGVVNGYGIYTASDLQSAAMTAPSGSGEIYNLDRYDLIQVAQDGVISIVEGKQWATPLPPDPDDNHIALAQIYHRVGETVIKNEDDSTNGYIIDKRDLVNRTHDYKGKLIDTQNETYYDSNSSTIALTSSWVNGLTVTFKPTVTDSTYLCEWEFDASLRGAIAPSNNVDIMYKIQQLSDTVWSDVTEDMYDESYNVSLKWKHKHGHIVFKNSSLTGLGFGYRIVFKYLTLSDGSIKNQALKITRIE